MIERVRTSGIFSSDGSDFEVENNVWGWARGDLNPHILSDTGT